MEDTKEVIGFLCRWCLLGLAWLLVAGTGWLVLCDMESQRKNLSARVIVPDFISHPPRYDDLVYLRCWIEPDAGTDRSVLWRGGDGEVSEAGAAGKTLYLGFRDAPRGGCVPIRVIGNPYSSLGFQREDAVLRIFPPGGILYLMDARMVCKRLGDGKAIEECKAVIEEFRRHGDVAMVLPDGEPQMADIRGRLRPNHFDYAILCRTAEGGLTQALRRAAWDIPHPANRMVTVTDDEEFASAMRRERWSVWFIQATPAPSELEHCRFDSLTKLKDSLARRPITR